ncbi:unnamed protein product [Blepharisma stoltei]|uniref:Ubiquitin carboxyl-terminal hydrolase n=1 Tax=Blepharisma stoltei TaxID=1481888 RepID=A0AAU9J0H7_9CILI|nr:unnamed protein product [Blepharisma stoltei]
MNWPALESDPEIFTQYFRTIGLSSQWEFSEIFSFDEEVEGSAILLAYKFYEQSSVFEGEPIQLENFIKQTPVLDNACGLIAALHGIFAANADLQEGSILFEIKSQIANKSPLEAAEVIINNQALHDIHLQFAAEGQSEITDCPNYHFVVLLPGFILYDGIKNNPIRLPCEGSLSMGFFNLVKQLIETERIAEDMNMMVLI